MVATDIKGPVSAVSMKWAVRMTARHEVHHFPYSMGSGHCAYPQAIAGDTYLKDLFYTARLLGNTSATPTGDRHKIANYLTRNPQPDPLTVDVLQSLLLDAGSYMGATPGEFISDYGYSDDIDEGLKAYKQCEATFRFFVRSYTLTEFDELIEAGLLWND